MVKFSGASRKNCLFSKCNIYIFACQLYSVSLSALLPVSLEVKAFLVYLFQLDPGGGGVKIILDLLVEIMQAM